MTTSFKKRLLTALLALIMAVSLLPAQAFAGALLEESPPAEALPYYLLITHVLDVEGETYGKTEMAFLTDEDFQDGVYDFRQNALDRTVMRAVRGSYQDKETYDLVESWTVTRDSFDMGGDPEDGSAYYALQLLIEYEVASGYTADVSNASGEPGEYDVMPLTKFTGGDLGNVTFRPADVVRLTLNFEYSRTGGMAGAPAADSAVIEVTGAAEPDGNGNVLTKTWELPSYSENGPEKYKPLENFRIVLDPEPLNAYLVDTGLAAEVMTWPLPFTAAQQERLEKALENGSFNVQTDNAGERPVYWVNDPDSNGGTAENRYGNRYSNNYNKAWEDARSISNDWFTASAAPGSGASDYKGGANKIPSPELTVTISEKQWNEKIQPLLDITRDASKSQDERDAAQAELDAGLTVTVYYRRNASFYNVQHWVPKDLAGTAPGGSEWKTEEKDGVTYCLVFTEQVQGRVGALTNAKDSPALGASNGVVNGTVDGLLAGTNTFDFTGVVAAGISQTVIEQRDEQGRPTTTVNIHYRAADNYRVIFDTNAAYIPRQQVDKNTPMKFDYSNNGTLTIIENGANKPVTEYKNPTRAGYTFAGWGYRLRDGIASDSGDYENDAGQKCRPLPDSATNSGVTIEDILSTAYITNSEAGDSGIKALLLYPKWTAGDANVRVVFWTENLDRTNGISNDVSVSVTGVYTGPYDPGSYINNTIKANTSYSNMGSFTFTAGTNVSLSSLTVEDGRLTGQGNITDLSDSSVAEKFKDAMGTIKVYTGDDQDLSAFYTLDHVSTTDAAVSADGATVINLYYNRNVYTAEFIYYGMINSRRHIATRTNGYAITAVTAETPFSIGGEGTSGYDKNNFNRWTDISSVAVLPVPEKVVITAKYGADLSAVWPVSNGESVSTGANSSANMISWTPTSGPYNQSFRDGKNSEPTIMGIYSAMSVDIISSPTAPEAHQYMYAYWEAANPSHYRNNHCYEVPDLNASGIANVSGVQEVVLYGSGSSNADRLYLVPVGNAALKNFSDLMGVKYAGGRAVYDEEEEYASASGPEYRAIRVFNNVCYAVAARVQTISSNYIAAQNPSARLHLTRVSNRVQINGQSFEAAPDHTTEYGNNAGSSWIDQYGPQGTPIGSADAPYDLYFYYTRERYKAIYTVPVTNNAIDPSQNGTDRVLGTIEIPYGAKLDKTAYGFSLYYQDSNDTQGIDNQRKYPWTLKDEEGNAIISQTVCPDRHTSGTATWTFSGWFLDRACKTAPSWDNMVTGNVRLYAGWNIPTYQVTFHLGGTGADGMGGIELSNTANWSTLREQQITANNTFTAGNGEIPRPTRDGHKLTGWYVADANGTLAENAAPFSFDSPITSNVHVAAKWERTETVPYYYRVWHLTEDPTAGMTTGEYTGSPTDNNGAPMTHTAGKTKWYVLGSTQVIADYKDPGDVLWLAASAFTGYVSRHPNHEYRWGEEHYSEGSPRNYYFYYDKTTLKEYKLNFILAGTEETTRIPAIDPLTGEATEPVLQPSFNNFAALKAEGYQLVKREGTGGTYTYKPVESAADLGEPYQKSADGTEATYLVQPIQYAISYVPGDFKDSGGLVTARDASAPLQEAIQELLDALTEEETFPDAVASGKNPGRYNVRSNTFALKNPADHVRIQVDGEYQWWRFTGWTSGNVSGDIDNGKAVTVDRGSVGNLVFRAGWERVDNDLQLVVCNKVTAADQGPNAVTVPSDHPFRFTITVDGGVDTDNILAYKGASKEQQELTFSDSEGKKSAEFYLRNGEAISFAGLTGSYTVTEDTTAAQFKEHKPEGQNWYYELRSASGGTLHGSSVTGTVTDAGTELTFNNEYTATVTLDTERETDGRQSFRVTKYLAEDRETTGENGTAVTAREHRSFFGGNHYYFLIDKGAQSTVSDAFVPLPASATRLDVPSAAGAASITGVFGELTFTRSGTYSYTIHEERPTAATMVPGVTYDPAWYRVKVTVAPADNDPTQLAVTEIAVEKNQRGTGDTYVPLEDGYSAAAISFENVYNPNRTTSSFQGAKVLTGGRKNAAGELVNVQDQEFTFRLTAAGSWELTENDVISYHAELAKGGDALENYLENKIYTPDFSQPMPSGVKTDGTSGVRYVDKANGSAGGIAFDGIAFDKAAMGANICGKAYKYTIHEVVPNGAVKNSEGKWTKDGITYDPAVKTIYVYVHLHDAAASKDPITSGSIESLSGVILYADAVGDRNFTFTNVYQRTPVDLEIGEDPRSDVSSVPLTKNIDGRSFQDGDRFTFELEAQDDAPMPAGSVGSPAKKTCTITPGSGTAASVLFGRITFTEPGTYVYKLRERRGGIAGMTYDEEVKTLAIEVKDDGKGRLTVAAAPVEWTNRYTKPDDPPPPERREPTLDKSAVSSVTNGGSFVYTLTVKGGSEAAGRVVVTDTLNDYLRFNEAEVRNGLPAGVTVTVSGQTLEFVISALAAEQTVMIRIPVTARVSGAEGLPYTIRNQAVMTADGGDLVRSPEIGTIVTRASGGQRPETPDPVQPPQKPDPVPPQKPDPVPPSEPDPAPGGIIPFPEYLILDDLVPLAAPHLDIISHFAYLIGYSDGTVRPDGHLTRAETAAIFFRLMLDDYRAENWSTENGFSDVDPSKWYHNAVSTCARAGLLTGYADGTFLPEAEITRAEFAVIASRFLGDDTPGYDYFTDLVDHWAYKEVARDVYAGWLRGDGRMFYPDERITRAEAVAIINRMINRFPDKDHLHPDMVRWPDNPESAWYYEDIQEATNSHDYEELDDMPFTEAWTTLLDDRDWAALEKKWAGA